MAGGNHFFWLGADADTSCGNCPLRSSVERAKREMLKIGFEIIEQHLDRAYDILDDAVPGCPA